MRATTAFNRLLRLQGARVTDVSFAADGVIVEVALRHRRLDQQARQTGGRSVNS